MMRRELSHDLREISRGTLRHYEESADAFFEGTRSHDVSQNYEALSSRLEGSGPFSILDLGCGPGRDLVHFRSRGYEAIGLDGAARFVDMARELSGCEVWHQDFLALDLPLSRFDGVFANASLFHVPSSELERVLGELHATLEPRGVLFSSNPHGTNVEGWRSGRYGAFLDHSTWSSFVTAAGFDELDHYYRPPGVARAHQPWLATVFRKRDAC